ncbi:MAG: hypothetical protein JW937_08075 [Candidatus Omnitrophica bacterium]|nr:hypothetical protein [Candidatus Omnitrophota bacterium]
MTASQGPAVLLGITGTIASFRSPEIVKALVQAGYRVPVILTSSGSQFVTPLSLRTFSGEPVYTDLWESQAGEDPLHITLAGSADLILVAPCTANILGRVANGICDDLLTCVIFASQAPVLFAPAMNVHMWEHPAVKRNVAVLKEWGYRFVGPVEGDLACKTYGVGHVAPLKEILAQVDTCLPKINT